MRIALAQMNPTVGALEQNLELALDGAQAAADEGADFIAFPAFALSGSPLRGLASSQAFQQACERAIEDFAARAPLSVLIGHPKFLPERGHAAYTAELFILDRGKAVSLGVPALAGPQDEFALDINEDEVQIGLCHHYEPGCALTSASLLLELCADPFESPYCAPAQHGRLERVRAVAKECGAYLASVNLVGGNDDVVYGGGSLVVGPDGTLVTAASTDLMDLIVFDVNEEGNFLDGRAATYVQSDAQMLWDACVLGTRDYLRKNGFSEVVIGLSGGIDSAVTAAVAVDALGSKFVHGVLMSGPYSSEGSVTDSLELADNLGIDTITLPIDEAYDTLRSILGESCGGEVKGLTSENLQARIRTLYLMALSNEHGWMMLNTGNKSEGAMGFSTLYGDTAGAYAPLGDLYKTQVYELARYRRSVGPSIPLASIEKAPSAELYENARDEDRLPPYELLDQVLSAHIDKGLGASELVAQGFEPDLVKKVLTTVKRNEFKRRSEPLAPHLGGVSLTEDRAWPVTCGFNDEPPLTLLRATMQTVS